MRATAGTCGQVRPSALEGVLDLLAGLLDVGARLVALALGLELLVVGRLAGGFLRLALELVGLVVELVVQTHRRSSCVEAGVSEWTRWSCHPTCHGGGCTPHPCGWTGPLGAPA